MDNGMQFLVFVIRFLFDDKIEELQQSTEWSRNHVDGLSTFLLSSSWYRATMV
jgi:hypothetical protein